MPTFPEHPADPRPAGTPPVAELVERVARERGLDFEPPPAAVTDALPALIRMIDELTEQLADAQERRWLAAVLAALSHHVQDSTLVSVEPATSSANTPVGGGKGVAVAVVTSPRGVLIGRRRDGIPRWVFPGGVVEDGETPAEAAVRECSEEAGLRVVASAELGSRVHPVTGRLITYVACSPVADDPPLTAAPDELVEVCWLSSDRIEERMPDLHDAVREHLGRHPGPQLES